MIGLRISGQWRPPQTVTVTLMYADGTVEELWTMEAIRAPAGALPGTRWYLACGPPGKPVPRIRQALVGGLPEGGMVVLLTDRDELGRKVYRAPKHSLN